MQQIDHIIHAKWVATGEKHQRLLDNHSVVIDKGIIQAIVPTQTAKETYQAVQVDTYPYHVVMPGFINAHTHAGMNYFRGLGCDLQLMNWLNHYIWPAEKKWLSHEFVREATLFAMAEMIRSGTTCFNDMFYFPEAIAEAAEIAGVRGFVSIHVIDFPTPWTQTTDESLQKGREFYEQYHNHPLITPTIAPHAPYTVCDESFIKVKAMADELHLKINMHVHETQAEIEHSLTNYKKRPIQRLQELGLISSDLIAIHSVQLNEEDLDILSDKRPSIVHCPVSNMKLASGICPVETLIERGINVALGTDSVASNNDLSMISEMRTAALLSKVSTLNPESLNVDDTIELATLNGARALGMERTIGSLQPGKAADIIAICMDDIETLPMFDPLVQIVYASSRHQVTDVWVAGKQLMKDRQLLTLDENALKEKARMWRV